MTLLCVFYAIMFLNPNQDISRNYSALLTTQNLFIFRVRYFNFRLRHYKRLPRQPSIFFEALPIKVWLSTSRGVVIIHHVICIHTINLSEEGKQKPKRDSRVCLHCCFRFSSGGVRTGIAMHCGCRIFKMAAKVEKFPRLYALYFDRHSSFLRKLSTIT